MFDLLEVFVKKINFNIVREKVLKCENMKIESQVDVNGKYNRQIKIMEILLKINLKGIDNNLNIIDLSVEMVGVFGKNDKNDEIIDDSALELFTKVKAPSVLFPFLLENIYSVTMRAKIKPLIIPYIDFKKLYFEQKDFKIVH